MELSIVSGSEGVDSMTLSEDKQALFKAQVGADFNEMQEHLIDIDHEIIDLRRRVAALEAACEFCLKQEGRD